MKRTRLILLLLIGGALIGGGVGYYMWNKPHQKVENADTIKVAAAKLSRDYTENEEQANKQYLNKALDVTGTVTNVVTNQDGQVVVAMQGETQDLSVQCTMRDKNVTPESGKEITVTGFCSGNTMFDVLLTDCIIK